MPDCQPETSQVIILDRDGVINYDSDAFVKSADEWIPIPHSIQAIARLSQAGWRIAIATNQSGVARGHFSEAILGEMHQKMLDLVTAAGGHISHIEYCPHGPDSLCECRKPKSGMIRAIGQAFKLANFEGVYMVGDSLRDLQAGAAEGCTPVLVRTGKGTKTLTELPASNVQDALIFADLADFADWVLGVQMKQVASA